MTLSTDKKKCLQEVMCNTWIDHTRTDFIRFLIDTHGEIELVPTRVVELVASEVDPLHFSILQIRNILKHHNLTQYNDSMAYIFARIKKEFLLGPDVISKVIAQYDEKLNVSNQISFFSLRFVLSKLLDELDIEDTLDRTSVAYLESEIIWQHVIQSHHEMNKMCHHSNDGHSKPSSSAPFKLESS
jgi:hypothetical protein